MAQISVSKIAAITGHNDSIYTLERANSTHFFSGAGDGMVVLWDMHDTENGQLIAKLPNSIYAIHTIGNHIVVGHNYDGIHTIDWTSKAEVSSLQITKAAIFDIKSIDNALIVATGDGEVILIDKESNTIKQRIKASEKSARCISVHPKGHQFAVGYSDHMVRVFDSNTLECVATLSAHTKSVFTVQYSPCGNQLFTAGRDAHLKVWSTTTYALEEDIAAHLYAVNHIAFDSTGNYFATCSMDKSVKVWDAKRLKLLKVIDKSRHAGHGTSVNKLLWEEGLHRLFSASDDRIISLWQIDLGESKN